MKTPTPKEKPIPFGSSAVTKLKNGKWALAVGYLSTVCETEAEAEQKMAEHLTITQER